MIVTVPTSTTSTQGGTSPAPAGGAGRGGFEAYRAALIHSWASTLAIIGCCLIPGFLVLDFFTMPRDLLRSFAWYRGIVTLEMLVHFLVIRRTRSGPRSYLHGYVLTTVTAAMIVQMTRDLGGFDSAYYAGLNLVIVGVNLMLPWRALHSALNSLLVISLYVVYNAFSGASFTLPILVNNLYFLGSTAIVAVAITFTKHRLIEQEYYLRAELVDANQRLDRSRQDLKAARDALWSEIEIARRIQTALLPRNRRLGPYDFAALMLPATEVGGDYYDIIETDSGEHWINVGDVSGHGVESGLVMMMTQTSILSTVTQQPHLSPSTVFRSVNRVLHENISRLGTNRYMTLNIIRLDDERLVLAGKHQDVLVWRASTRSVETLVNQGCWLGMVPDTLDLVDDFPIHLHTGDLLLLFTDGITEATSSDGQMFGQDRLADALSRVASLPLETALESLLSEVRLFAASQDDDITLLLLRRA